MKRFLKLAIVFFVLIIPTTNLTADQTRIPNYNTARDVYVYDQIYPFGGRTLYCNSLFTNRSGLQVEHVLPASWMKERVQRSPTIVQGNVTVSKVEVTSVASTPAWVIAISDLFIGRFVCLCPSKTTRGLLKPNPSGLINDM